MTHILTRLLLSLLLCVSLSTAYAGTASPQPQATPSALSASDVVKQFYAELLDTMKQGDKLGFAGRYKKLSPTIQSTFNLPYMTRASIGLVWSKASPQEQQALISAFSDFSVATYASRFADYDGEAFNIVGQKEMADSVMVETTIKPREQQAVAINYVMQKDENGSYRIVDVFLNGTISELATRRAEFNAIVKRDGISALVTTLGEKSKQMGPS